MHSIDVNETIIFEHKNLCNYLQMLQWQKLLVDKEKWFARKTTKDPELDYQIVPIRLISRSKKNMQYNHESQNSYINI